jgi:hypothetical protein
MEDEDSLTEAKRIMANLARSPHKPHQPKAVKRPASRQPNQGKPKAESRQAKIAAIQARSRRVTRRLSDFPATSSPPTGQALAMSCGDI